MSTHAVLVQAPRRTFGALSTNQARAVLEVHPDPVATIRRAGPRPYRMLAFGGGALRGLGFRDHDLGLPGRIADEVVRQTRRGVQLDIVVETSPTSAAALALLSGLRLRRYDAVIVLVAGDAARAAGADRWRGALVGLTRLLQDETSPAAGVFVYEVGHPGGPRGVAALTSRTEHRSRLTEVTKEVCSLTQRVQFGELRPIPSVEAPSDHVSESTCREWADTVVRRLGGAFRALADADPATSPHAFRNRPEDERFRQRAVDALRLRRGVRDERLDRELAVARTMYRTTSAALNILDGDLQWVKASSGVDTMESPRALAFCNFAIGSDELTLINDTWLDPRTRSNPSAHGPAATRFYAGFPVRSLDGYRIGMVCVFGGTPRAFRPSDFEGLRAIAARVEQHVWNEFLSSGRR